MRNAHTGEIIRKDPTSIFGKIVAMELNTITDLKGSVLHHIREASIFCKLYIINAKILSINHLMTVVQSQLQTKTRLSYFITCHSNSFVKILINMVNSNI